MVRVGSRCRVRQKALWVVGGHCEGVVVRSTRCPAAENTRHDKAGFLGGCSFTSTISLKNSKDLHSSSRVFLRLAVMLAFPSRPRAPCVIAALSGQARFVIG